MTKSTFKWLLLAALTTFHLFANVVTIQFNNVIYTNDDEVITEDMANENRNERSTPRSFILPRTPAVAIEQERDLALKQLGYNPESCLTPLSRFAREPNTFQSLFDAKAIEALINFQKSKGLAPTGHLNADTRERLGC